MNRLLEMISWPNIYGIPTGVGYNEPHETMGYIFDNPRNDPRKEYYMPFYNALRARCIRQSHYYFDGGEPTIEEINSEDLEDGEEIYPVFDIHDHPLTGAACYDYIEGHLRQHGMKVEDKNRVRCYYPGCAKRLTLSEVKYIVTPEFYAEYTRPRPQKLGLDQFVSFFDDNILLVNEKSIDPQHFGNIFHHTICPFCIQFESRDEGCIYLTHDINFGMDDYPHCKEQIQIVDIINKYKPRIEELFAIEYGGEGIPIHFEFCAECGRPCANHQHISLEEPYEFVKAADGRRANYGTCTGGGRAELFARVLAIREVYRTTNGINSLEERRLAAIAADNAPKNAELMEKGRQIAAMAVADRVWGNAELPKVKHYTNEIYQENNQDDEKEEGDEKEEHEEIYNGGRFKQSRKKQVRRKKKTLRNLLKKLK
jgi:hypothetical protein